MTGGARNSQTGWLTLPPSDATGDEALLRAVREKGSKNLTVVSSNVGTGERGLGLLAARRLRF